MERDTPSMRKHQIVKVNFFSKKMFKGLILICLDDDECTLNRHSCYDPYECYNTKGKIYEILVNLRTFQWFF